MSMAIDWMPLAEARAIAEHVRAVLAPCCTRIEIAGSIRRERPTVGDIEIVAIPRRVPDGLFDDVLVRDPGFVRTVNQWPKVYGEPTGKHTQRRLPEGIKLDLFMVEVDTWGTQYAVRTGSAEFTHRILATGWVKAGYTSLNAVLYRQGQRVPVREESELFDLIGRPWIEPQAREV